MFSQLWKGKYEAPYAHEHEVLIRLSCLIGWPRGPEVDFPQNLVLAASNAFFLNLCIKLSPNPLRRRCKPSKINYLDPKNFYDIMKLSEFLFSHEITAKI